MKWPRVRLLGPIFPVEMITTARRSRYFWLRVIYALLLLFLLWLSYSSNLAIRRDGYNPIQAAADFGEDFFMSFAYAHLMAGIVVTIAVTAGTIAEERDRRTIEYLFATDLTNSEIVLGKLTARILIVVAFLFTAAPILSLTLLFGGVSAEHLQQLFAVTASTVVTVACISICVSIWSHRARDAVVRSFLVLLFLLIFMPISYALAIAPWSPIPWLAVVTSKFLVANPFFFVFMNHERMPSTIVSPGWEGVLGLLAYQMALCLPLLILGILRVRRLHLQVGSSPAKGADSARWLRWLSWRPSIGDHPMMWKESFSEQRPRRMGWLGRLVFAFLLLAVLSPLGWFLFRYYFVARDTDEFRIVAYIYGVVLGTIFLTMTAARAATSATTEKERQTWDTLLSTTLSGGEIVVGKTVGTILSLRWLIGLLVLIWLLAAALEPFMVVRGAFQLFTLLALSPFFAGVGVFLSLRNRTSTRALCLSLLISLLLAGFYLIFVAPLAGFNEIVFAPCFVYLVAFPLFYDGNHHNELLGTYVMGAFGYHLLAWLLLRINSMDFDRLAGRNARRSDWE